MASIVVPYISDEEMRARAEAFLGEHHPARTIPIPIEGIVDLRFGIDIIPMPGFHLNYELDAFISTDLTEIRVNKAVHEHKNQNRYRFSLAHELAHRILHEPIFRGLHYGTVAEYKASRDAIPEREYSRLEFQAYAFAGLVLVPPPELRRKFEEARAYAEKAGIDLADARPESWDMIERWIATDFKVSQAVIAKRGRNDGLWQG